MTKPVIELQNVSFSYGEIPALRDITLTVSEGEVVTLEGSNGCGKSTLLRLINGLIFPDAGTYVFEGTPITEKALKDNLFAKQFHQKLGFVFQNADVQLFCASVEEEIAFGPLQMGLSEEEAKQRTNDVLSLLELEALRERPPYQLSGGEKRKVALGCILSMNPKVLVLDEPLAGLDRRTQDWLLAFLQTLKSAGRTMVLATHNEDLAAALADRRILFTDDHTLAGTR